MAVVAHGDSGKIGIQVRNMDLAAWKDLDGGSILKNYSCCIGILEKKLKVNWGLYINQQELNRELLSEVELSS